MFVYEKKWLYLDEVVAFEHSACIRVKCLYSGKSCSIRAYWLYSGKVVLFGQGGCIRAKWLYLGKFVVLEQKLS